jgi:hypothetical protein
MVLPAVLAACHARLGVMMSAARSVAAAGMLQLESLGEQHFSHKTLNKWFK